MLAKSGIVITKKGILLLTTNKAIEMINFQLQLATIV